MMRGQNTTPRRPVRRMISLAVALGALTGCRALERDVVAVEYRPDRTLASTTAAYDATYYLHAPATEEKSAPVKVPKGATVGFVRESDGVIVAIAGEERTALPDEKCVWKWKYTQRPVTRWDRFVSRTITNCGGAIATAWLVALSPCIIVNGMITGEWP